jgi:membrane fusion protein, multidrug efflux system
MKKKRYVLFMTITMLLGFYACNKPSEQENTAEEIRQQISNYREQINELTNKVHNLERKLIDMGETDAVRNRIPVNTQVVDYSYFENFIRVSGTVEAVNTALISPETSGHLQHIYVKKGEAVTIGQVIARLSTQIIENSIEEIQTNLRLAETVYERQKRLWEQEIGSEMQFLEAKNNAESLRKRLSTLESQLEQAVIRAPIDGFVDETFLKEGELAMPGSPLMEIINLDELYINADVSEAYLPYVNRGEKVILRFPAWPEMEMEVPVHRIGHVINPENRSFRLQLRIANTNQKLKPNMMASINIQSYSIENAIVVPTMLIGYDTQGHYVFTASERNGQMVSTKTYIERGPDAEGNTLIEEGLQKGDMLILQGHHRLSEGDPVRINNEE